jgi:hypothetical protein
MLTLQVPESLGRLSSDLQSVLTEKLAEFEITDKIICGVSDCAAVMRKTLKLSNITWSPCSCHILNSAVKDMIKKIDIFKNLYSRSKYLNGNPKFHQFLDLFDKQSRKTIPIYTEIRWLSVYETLQSISDLKAAIQNFQVFTDNKGKHYYSDKFNIFEDDEFQETDTILPVMKELNQTFLKLEKSTHESIFICLQQLTYVSETLSSSLRQVNYINAAEALRNGIVARLLKYQIDNVPQRFIMGTILNPNLNYEEVITDELRDIASKTLEEIESIIQTQEITLPENSPRQRGKRVFSQPTDELARYLNSQTNRVSNICEYWKSKRDDFPNLSKIALKLSIIPSNSSVIERMFSQGRSVLTYNMGASEEQTISERMFLFINKEFTEAIMDIEE